MKNNNQVRILGMILFVVGGIIAISAAAKMPSEGAEYPSTTGIFVFGFLMGIVGNVLWHKTERKKVMLELEIHKNDQNYNPIVLLQSTVPAIAELNQNFNNYPGMALCEKIDEIQDNFVHPFTERRKTFMDILGVAKGAEILLIIAYAERMLNRVWSAASDGYPDEAKACLKDSLENYQKALSKI